MIKIMNTIFAPMEE